MGKLALRVTELVNYVDLDGNVAYEYRTPAWQPIYKRLERFTPSCMQVMQSLDEFIEHNKERLMARNPKLLEPSRCSNTGHPVNGQRVTNKPGWAGGGIPVRRWPSLET